MKTYSFLAIDNCNMCRSSQVKTLGLRYNRSQGFRGRLPGIAVAVSRCLDCGLVYCNPQPIPESPLDHYGVPPESYWSKPDYYTRNPNYFASEIATVKRLLPFHAGMTALDVGAGLGKGMLALSEADSIPMV